MRRHKHQAARAGSNLRRIVRRPAGRRLWLVAVIVIAGCSVAVAVRAYNRRAPGMASTVAPFRAAGQSSAAQPAMRESERLEAKLTLQPEADRMRRRLGQRFQAPGREVSSMTGTLTVGSDHKPVRITRIQNEAGEQVSVALGQGDASLSWSADDGVTSGGKAAADADRSLVERLVFDSPDQFVQAQLRMASYFTVVRNAMPGEAKGSDDYTGPSWNVVRVAEPERSAGKPPLSSYRLYYINASTGLIDKVAYEEGGQTIVADLSGWIDQAGETVPTRIVWTRNKQVLMELVASSISHGPKQ